MLAMGARLQVTKIPYQIPTMAILQALLESRQQGESSFASLQQFETEGGEVRQTDSNLRLLASGYVVGVVVVLS